MTAAPKTLKSRKTPNAAVIAGAAPCSAIVMWDNGGMNVAIPKRNGKGYLRVPLGHHFNEALNNIENSEHVDACGLDGYLELEYGYTGHQCREEIMKRVMPQLAKIFRFQTWREDTKAFWKIVLPNREVRRGGPDC